MNMDEKINMLDRMNQFGILAEGMNLVLDKINEIDETKLTDADAKVINLLSDAIEAVGLHMVSMLLETVMVKK